MTVHVLVEGSSERVLLEVWGRRLLKQHPFKVHPHQGKGRLPSNLNQPPSPKARGLLDQLPAKLRGFARSLNPDRDSVVILVDADDDDVESLAVHISEAAEELSSTLKVIVRLAIEETEAFYLGDLQGLKAAFPHADMKLARKFQPDSICGTWEYFGKVVGDNGGNKVAWAEAMGPKLTTKAKESRSASFREFVAGLCDAKSYGDKEGDHISPRSRRRRS